jgi:prepilin-type processing-associated H-X9-DG protein
MVATMGIGVWEVLILLLAGGGSPAGFLSMPPLPPDAKLAAAAPADCLLYVHWAGIATPNPASANATEQLLAEPQVQHLIQTVKKELKDAFVRETSRGEEGRVIASTLPQLVETLLTRPTAFYITDVQMSPRGPSISGALVVNVGDQADAVHNALTQITGLVARGPGARPQPGAPPGPPAPATRQVNGVTFNALPLPPNAPVQIEWGMANQYAVIALGAGTAEQVVNGLTGAAAKQPDWLATLHTKLAVPRQASIGYLNVRKLAATVAQFAGPRVPMIVSALGLDNVESVASVTGLDATGFVGKSLVSVTGEPKGIVSILAGKPINAAALGAVPADATFALALGIDPAEVYQTVRQIAAQLPGVGPRSAQDFAEFERQFQQELGFRLNEDLLAQLGPTWTLHNAPSDGGLLITGLTATVEVRDAVALGKSYDALMTRLNAELNDRPRPRVALAQTDYANHRIYFLNPIREDQMPISPAWCLTDKSLVVSLYPQMVKSYLDRVAKADPKASIAGNPEAAKLLQGAEAPSSVSYTDTRQVFELVYPALHPLATIVCAQIQKAGVNIDMSLLPSASAVLPHLLPGSSFSRRTVDGIYMESHGSLPVGNALLGVQGAAFFVGFSVPTVARARGAALDTQSMNNLRQFGIAAMSYAVDHEGKLPAKVEELGPYLNIKNSLLRDPWGQPYLYFGGGKKVSELKGTSTYPLFASSHVVNGQRIVGFADGHVERQTEGTFRQTMQDAGLEPPPFKVVPGAR